jgi:riboflavin kinase/FMN adenylyltransferase
MKVHRNSDSLPPFRRAVLTIGTFDGVHSGHQQILRQLKEEARLIDGETVIVTFHPHPRRIIPGQKPVNLINTLEEKIQLLSSQGIDHLVIIPFTEAFSRFTAEAYVRDFLVAHFHPHSIIIGYDHRFGQGRKGDYELLENLSPVYNYVLREIPVHVLDAASVSSTRIRQAVSDCDIQTANELLGYPFFFEAKVVKGNMLGRTIGYPTANLEIQNDEKLIPGNGVYAVELAVIPDENEGYSNSNQSSMEINTNGEDALLRGMMNIGFRPTINGTKQVIEVNIFDFNQDIYGRTLRVYVKKYLRAEQKFAGLDALKDQLQKDKENALAFFASR